MPDPLAGLSMAPDTGSGPPPPPTDPLSGLSMQPDTPGGDWVRRGILLVNTKTHQAIPAPPPPGAEPGLGDRAAVAAGDQGPEPPGLLSMLGQGMKGIGAPVAGLVGKMVGASPAAQMLPDVAEAAGALRALPSSVEDETRRMAEQRFTADPGWLNFAATTGADVAGQAIGGLGMGGGLARGALAAGEAAAPELLASTAARRALVSAAGAAEGAGFGAGAAPEGQTGAGAAKGAALGLLLSPAAWAGTGHGNVSRETSAGPSVADAADAAPAALYERAMAAAPPEARAAVADAWEGATGHKAPDAAPEPPAPPGLDAPASPLTPMPSEAGYVSLPGQGKAAAALASDEVFNGARAPYVAATDKARFVAGLRYIDDAAAFPRDLGADMRSAYEQTPNPAIPGDTTEAALARVMDHPQGGQAALDAMDAWRTEAEGLRQQLNVTRDQQGLPEIPQRQNYLTLRLASDAEDQPTIPVQGGDITVEQTRDFPTAYDAVKAGRDLQPGTADWAGALRATRETYGAALAQRDLAGTLADFAGRDLADGRPAVALGSDPPPDYVKSTIPFVNQALSEAAGEGAPLGQVYLHPQLAENLDPILRGTTSGPIGRGYDALNSLLKQTTLLGGFFHPIALTESLVDTLGLGRGLTEAASHGFGLPGLAQLAHYLGGGKFSEDAALRAIQWGTTLEPPTTDVEASALGRVLAAGQEWGAQPQTGPIGSLVGGAAQAAQSGIGFLNNALWTYHHLPAKVSAFNLLADAVDRVRAGQDWAMGPGGFAQRNAIRAAPAADLYRGIARGVNDNFGGQNWRLMRNSLMSNPQALQAVRRAMLAPDWLTSSARAFVSPLAPNPARSAMGINYYVNAGKLFGLYQLINQATSGHFTWQNGPGGAFDLYKLASLQVGHDQAGKPVFWNVGKHFLELPHLLFGRNQNDLPVLGPLAGKMAPLPRAAAEVVSDATAARGMPSVKAGAALRDATSPLVPINVRNAWRLGQKQGLPGAAEGFFSPFPIGR